MRTISIKAEYLSSGIKILEEKDDLLYCMANMVKNIFHMTYRNEKFFHNNHEKEDDIGYARFLEYNPIEVVEYMLEEIDIILSYEQLETITEFIIMVIAKIRGNKDKSNDFHLIAVRGDIVLSRSTGDIYKTFWRNYVNE